MWTNAFAAMLCIAPLALCAPVPMVLVDDLAPPTVGAHPLAPVALKPGQTLQDALEERERIFRQPIDNRPMTPSSTMDPSAVLSAPHPVETTYLLSLSMGKPKHAAPVEDFEVILIDEFEMTEEGLKVLSPAATQEGRRKPGMPCYYARMRRDYNDLLLISAILIFILIIVLVEACETIREHARQFTCRHGTIRLDSNNSNDGTDEKKPLSIRAEPIDRTSTQGL